MAISTEPIPHRRALRVLATIVALNALIFVVLRLCAAFGPTALQAMVENLAVSTDYWYTRPWTFVTYMFTQYDELHILLNMLWLAWFWLLIAEAGIGARSIAATYLAGGLGAAVVYIALSPGGMLIGSSGAVMAVVAAAAVAIPHRRIDLPLLRPVSVLAAAGTIIIISAICMAYSSPWSHAAHLAGIIAGAIAGCSIRIRRRSQAKARNMQTLMIKQVPDALLEKIRTSGFESLSETERILVINSTLRQPAKRQ